LHSEIAARKSFDELPSEVDPKIVDIQTRRIRRSPSPHQQARLHVRREAEAKHEDHDHVVAAATSATTAEVLRVQVAELARETANLKFDRIHAQDSRERQRICSRRVKALGALASATIELHNIEAGAPSPGVVRRVLEVLLADVMTTASEVLDPDSADRFAAAVRRRFDGGLMDDLVAKR
jgi:hypothetical protein